MALFQALAQAGGPPAQVLMDSSAVKAHPSAAGGKGGSRAKRLAARAGGARPRSARDRKTREVLGRVIGTALGWGAGATVALAFVLGYALTRLPLLRSGRALGAALGLALASDTASITIMEIVDNGIVLAIPGSMDAPLSSPLLWRSLAVALVFADAFAFRVKRSRIARGRGHVLVHAHHRRRAPMEAYLVLAATLPASGAFAHPSGHGHDHGAETAYVSPGDPAKSGRVVEVS